MFIFDDLGSSSRIVWVPQTGVLMNDKDFSRLAARANDNPMALRAYEVEVERRAAAAIARVRLLITPDAAGAQNAA